MTRSPERTQDLRVIHSTARKLGLSDFARRALMYEVTGRDSALEMTASERGAVIAALAEERAQPAPLKPSDYSDEACLELLGL